MDANTNLWLQSLLDSLPNPGPDPGHEDPPAALHRTDDLRAVHPGPWVFICDRAPDADRLWSAGLVATAPHGGLAHWQPACAAPLRGHDVVILAPPGNDHLDAAVQIAVDLRGVALSVRVLLLDSLTSHDSIAAWLDDSGSPADLVDRAQTLPPLHLAATFKDRPAPKRPGAVVTRLSAVAPRPVEWLWQGWLPLGKLAILGGHPGVGKSTLAAAIAATLSVAAPWPDGTAAPLATTIFLLAEDAADDTLRPRLDQLGADPARILTLDAVDEGAGHDVYFNLGKHLDALEQAIVAEDARLVVIDPLSAFLPRRNRNDEGDVRDLLTPLARMAERRSVAVLAIMHVGKQGLSGRTALQSLLGATAFGAIARSVIMAAPIPTPLTGGPAHNVLAVVKSNLSKTPPPLAWSRPFDGPLLWHGPTTHDIESLLGAIPGHPRASSLDAAEAFLLETLAQGPVPTATVEDAAIDAGINPRTLDRARKRLGVESKRIGGKTGTWNLILRETRLE